MGLSLSLLGGTLLLALIVGFDVIPIFWSWWPAILILLGLEILVYLFLNKSEQPFVKYDMFSILFIGVMGMIGMILFIISSIGVADEISALVSAQEETFDFPSHDIPVPGDVEQIVLDFGTYPVSVEGIDSDQVSIFGTYRLFGPGGIEAQSEDYVTANRKGAVLYVTLKAMPRKIGLVSNHISADLTVTVPDDVKLTVKGDTRFSLQPRQLQSNWVVQNVPMVDVYVDEDSDLQLIPDSTHSVTTDESEHEQVDEGGGTQTEALIIGEGTHRIQFLNADSVNIYHSGE